MSDTIAAVATARAPSANGLLRLSGPLSIAILDRVFTPVGGPPMAQRADRALVYGVLKDEGGHEIDRCLATVSRAPHSYTGEDTAELQCHGSPALLSLGLETLFAAGARQALAGEFTRRAFLNGRLDLAQAEGVADLLDARTPAAVRAAAGQLAGRLSARVDEVYQILTDLMAHFHAVLDYPDEDIDPFEADTIREALCRASNGLQALLSTYERGRYLKDGLPCAIVGRPNAGKSTLFNALLGYDRAIVTGVPGTTRDTVEEVCVLGGVPLRLIDTAGLRAADDPVERLGVERSRAAVGRAELVLVLHDSTEEAPSPEDRELIDLGVCSGKPWIYVETKRDLSGAGAVSIGTVGEGQNLPVAAVCLSAVTGKGMDELERAVAGLFPAGDTSGSEVVLTNARQAQAARRALEAVERAGAALSRGLSPDAVLTDVEEAMSALGELTGRSVRADITDRIFERFCVGK